MIVADIEADGLDQRRQDAEIYKLKLRGLFRTIQEGVLIVDAKTGQITDVNPYLVKLLGYSKEEFEGKHIWDLQIFKDIAASKDSFEELKEKKSLRIDNLPMQSRSGEIIDVEVFGSVYGDEDKNILYLVVDIKERVKQQRFVESELVKVREYMAGHNILIDSIKDAVITANDEGIILEWNPSAEIFFGYQRDEIVGKPLTQIIPSKFHEAHLVGLRRVASGGEPHLIGKTVELMGLKKDGTEFPIEMTLSQWRDNGNIFYTGIIRDITERKKMDEKLRTEVIKNKLLFESSRDALMMITPPLWKFTRANRATLQLFGAIDTDQFIALGPLDVSPEKQPDGRLSSEKVQEAIATAIREGSNFFEWDYKRLDGTVFNADVLLTRMEVEDEVFVQATVRDITDRKKHEKKILELAEVRNTFIQIVSHQLRTPLTSMRWNLEAFLNESFGSLTEEQKDFTRLILGANVDIINRTHDMLVVLDIEEGRGSFLNKQKASLEALLASVLVGFEKRINIKNITLKYIPQKPTAAVSVDVAKIREVFEKLIENAVIYTNEKGEISVSLNRDEGYFRLEVVDTGIGIPATEQENIFGRFYRASNSFVMDPSRTGVGLFISKYFVEQHGGKIGFESHEGKGSKFWVELPVE